MHTLPERIRPYVDENGLVLPHKNTLGVVPETGNGVLYTGIYYVLQALWGYSPSQEKTLEFLVTMRMCRVLSDDPGLYHRAPEKTEEWQAWDDYVGLTAASAFMDGGMLALGVLDYGQRHGWVYNNIQPGKFAWRAWFGRFPHVIAHFSYAAGKHPTLWPWMYWWANIAKSALLGQSSPNSAFLEWLMIQTEMRFAARHKKLHNSRLARWVLRKWFRTLRKKWPGGMHEVMSKYFNADPYHPLVLHMLDFEDTESRRWR